MRCEFDYLAAACIVDRSEPRRKLWRLYVFMGTQLYLMGIALTTSL